MPDYFPYLPLRTIEVLRYENVKFKSTRPAPTAGDPEVEEHNSPEPESKAATDPEAEAEPRADTPFTYRLELLDCEVMASELLTVSITSDAQIIFDQGQIYTRVLQLLWCSNECLRTFEFQDRVPPDSAEQDEVARFYYYIMAEFTYSTQF